MVSRLKPCPAGLARALEVLIVQLIVRVCVLDQSETRRSDARTWPSYHIDDTVFA